MSEEQTITLEVDGQTLTAKPGQMLIEVTDAAGITVPRFCYHKKLSISASCRMCLVEVENAPKPLPACATPVMDGMKAYTRSPLARQAQKGTMEFLLINHPLDCPICDQGGECELQDVAMGYGGDVSRFSEGKRVVKSENIGDLIATDMTRCIHCTRCVRFGEEIAGIRELGATGRGEHMQIGVYVQHTVASELSGNVIDLCPVGALTAKPSQYRARAWELTQRDGIAAHDAVGSAVHFHVRRNQVMRVVPKENEQVNETWISDRDRFSYAGLYAEDRLQEPMVRVDGNLEKSGWHDALVQAAKILKSADSKKLGTLVSPSATLEEMYLAQKLGRELGSNNIDHRLRQSDFRLDETDPVTPWLGQKFADLAGNNATLLVGSWLRKDQPILNHWLRKSVLAGGEVMAINPLEYDFNYELTEHCVCTPSGMLSELAGVAAALGADTAGLEAKVTDKQKVIAEKLKAAGQGSVILGAIAHSHPDFKLLRRLAGNIATAANVSLGLLAEGANVTGAWMAGVVPHRGVAGSEVSETGLDAGEMTRQGMETYLMVNVEPEFDVANPAVFSNSLEGAKVVALSGFMTPWLEAHADVVLPMAQMGETSGTQVNAQGDVQSFNGVVKPAGAARPGWKILRVLGNLVDIEGFEYEDSEQVRDELLSACEGLKPDNSIKDSDADLEISSVAEGLQRVGGVPMYSVDSLVRRSPALQNTPDSWCSGIRISSSLGSELGMAEGDSAVLKQGEYSVTLPLIFDERVPDTSVWMPTGVPGSELLAEGFGAVMLEKA